MNHNQTSPKDTNQTGTKMHPSNEPSLLFFIGQNFEDWFSPQEVVDKLGQLTALEIQEFCKRYVPYFFGSQENGDDTNWRFKKTFKISSTDTTGRDQPASELSTSQNVEKRQINEIALLNYVLRYFPNEFTPEEVYERLKNAQQLTLEEIRRCLLGFSMEGFFDGYSHEDEYHFTANFRYVK